MTRLAISGLNFLGGYSGFPDLAPNYSNAHGTQEDDDQDTVKAGEAAGEDAAKEEAKNNSDDDVKDKEGANKKAREKAICDGLAALKKKGPKHFKDCPECPKGGV
jgi:hypothetical protein